MHTPRCSPVPALKRSFYSLSRRSSQAILSPSLEVLFWTSIFHTMATWDTWTKGVIEIRAKTNVKANSLSSTRREIFSVSGKAVNCYGDWRLYIVFRQCPVKWWVRKMRPETANWISGYWWSVLAMMRQPEIPLLPMIPTMHRPLRYSRNRIN